VLSQVQEMEILAKSFSLPDKVRSCEISKIFEPLLPN